MSTRVTPMRLPLAAPPQTVPASSWPLLGLIKKVCSWHAHRPAHSIPPIQRPLDRAPATVDGIDRYVPGAPVWAYIGGTWLAATVADTTGSSALVTYLAPGSADTLVETVHVTHLQLQDPLGQRSHDGAPSANDSPGAVDFPTSAMQDTGETAYCRCSRLHGGSYWSQPSIAEAISTVSGLSRSRRQTLTSTLQYIPCFAEMGNSCSVICRVRVLAVCCSRSSG